MLNLLPSSINPEDWSDDEATHQRVLNRLIKDDSTGPINRHLRRLAAIELLKLYPERDATFRKRLVAALEGIHQIPRTTLEEHAKFQEMRLEERNRRRTIALLAFLNNFPAETQLAADCLLRLGAVAGPETIPAIERIARRGSATVFAAAREAIRRVARAKSMTLVFCAMEAQPYAGTGGLGNVMKELPKTLARMGHRVLVLTPRHSTIDRDQLEVTGMTGQIVNIDGPEPFQILRDMSDGVEVYFIENDRYFSKGRNGVYGDSYGIYGDNEKRYDFFGCAIPQALLKILKGDTPDVIQLNDAHTASAAYYTRSDPRFSKTKLIMAVHNLGGAYQGRFPARFLPHFCFPPELFYPMGPAEFFGEINLLKLGIVECDGTIFVSRHYMHESLADGEGLEGVLREVRAEGRLWGNLNGIDEEVWNPETDPHLEHHFSAKNPSGKTKEKLRLQARVGLEPNADIPVVGVLGRLAWQKGWEDTMRAVEHTIESKRRAQFILCGAGDPEIATRLYALADRYPDHVRFDSGFSVAKEHQIYAGSDLFLMPSRFEPCGLPQMYAVRYLTAPIVRAVGGLEESIDEYDPAEGTGNGFKFLDDVTEAMDRALDWYEGGPSGRAELLELLSACDFSWDRTSAPEQVAFYREILFHES